MADDDKKKRRPAKPSKKTRAMIQSPVKPATPQVSDMIGNRLRSYYDEVAKQPVPERFLDLLDQLESKSQAKKGG